MAVLVELPQLELVGEAPVESGEQGVVEHEGGVGPVLDEEVVAESGGLDRFGSPVSIMNCCPTSGFWSGAPAESRRAAISVFLPTMNGSGT